MGRPAWQPQRRPPLDAAPSTRLMCDRSKPDDYVHDHAAARKLSACVPCGGGINSRKKENGSDGRKDRGEEADFNNLNSHFNRSKTQWCINGYQWEPHIIKTQIKPYCTTRVKMKLPQYVTSCYTQCV